MPLTLKARGARMGKGKGGFKKWYVHVKPGVVLFRLRSSKILVARVVLGRIAYGAGHRCLVGNILGRRGRNVGYW